MDGRREHSGFRSCRTGAWSGGSYGLVAIIVAAVLLFVVVPILSLRHWQLVETRRAEVQATREILSNFEVYLNAFKKAAGRYPTTAHPAEPSLSCGGSRRTRGATGTNMCAPERTMWTHTTCAPSDPTAIPAARMISRIGEMQPRRNRRQQD
jgi:hypothetical protein